MKKILLVEDDQILANIYRNKFAVEGYGVETAASAEAALELLSQFAPDLAIVDLVLPKMSGLDLMRQIRGQNQFRTLPLVVFSNTYLSTMIQEAWKIGAAKCLSKANSSPNQLLEVVRQVLNPSAEPPAKPAASPTYEPRAKLTSPAQPRLPGAPLTPELRQNFGQTLANARMEIQQLAKAGDTATRLNHSQALYRQLHELTGAAHLGGLADFAQLAEATEALIMELHQKPEAINASSLRTLAAAIDCLPLLFNAPPTATAKAAQARSLVVDDDAISRRAISHALNQAKLKFTEAENPEAALQLLGRQKFDLVFLDVDMPGMSGHELCAKLRSQTDHQTTPVVFVTGLNDLQNRANSMVSGGNDFIAKPFLFMELAVKSLVYVLRGKYQKPGPRSPGLPTSTARSVAV